MSGKKFIYGVGINNADYAIKKYEELPRINGKQNQKLVWICPFYDKWKGMLKRCYSENYKDKRPTYEGCSVCDEWLTFSKFKSWMETQDWEDKQLDKDLLVYQNKAYSPETCCFLSSQLNQFLVKNGSRRGEYPIGVCYLIKRKQMVKEHINPYQSHISYRGKSFSLGMFNNDFEAHRAWQKAKAALAFDLSLEQTDERVKQGLIRVYEKILTDYEQNLETVDF